MWPFTRKGGLSKFHAMAIFTVVAVKLLKNYWNVSEISLSRREKFTASVKYFTPWKGSQSPEKYFTPWNKVILFEKISHRETKWTSYINIILLLEHYALIVTLRLQRFYCRHYWMSFRIGYLSANRQLRVRAILSFVCFSVFYCGFGKTKENKIKE